MSRQKREFDPSESQPFDVSPPIESASSLHSASIPFIFNECQFSHYAPFHTSSLDTCIPARLNLDKDVRYSGRRDGGSAGVRRLRVGFAVKSLVASGKELSGEWYFLAALGFGAHFVLVQENELFPTAMSTDRRASILLEDVSNLQKSTTKCCCRRNQRPSGCPFAFLQNLTSG